MERLYYVQRDNETVETSDSFEAARIAAEWIRRGYKVSEIAVDVTDEAVQLADGPNGVSAATATARSTDARPGHDTLHVPGR
jgi:hypothetical protein